MAHAEVKAEDVGDGSIERNVQFVDIALGGELRQRLYAYGQGSFVGDVAGAQLVERGEGLLEQAQAVGRGVQAEVAGHGPEAFAVSGGSLGRIVPSGHPTKGSSGRQGAVVVAEGAHGVVVKSLVHVEGFGWMAVDQGEGRTVEVADEVLHLRPVDRDHHHPARVGGIAVDGQLEEVGTFPGFLLVAGGAEVARPSPLLEVGRGVDAHLLLQRLGHYHHPATGGLVEEDGRVAELGAVDVQHGVSFVVMEGAATVGAVGDGLRLLLGIFLEGSVDGHVGSTTESGRIVFVDDDGAGEVRDILVLAFHAEGREFIVAGEVGRLQPTPPVHAVAAVVMDKTARVAYPATTGAEMILRAIGFRIKRVGRKLLRGYESRQDAAKEKQRKSCNHDVVTF